MLKRSTTHAHSDNDKGDGIVHELLEKEKKNP